jgi:hypothetical protein
LFQEEKSGKREWDTEVEPVTRIFVDCAFELLRFLIEIETSVIQAKHGHLPRIEVSGQFASTLLLEPPST